MGIKYIYVVELDEVENQLLLKAREIIRLEPEEVIKLAVNKFLYQDMLD